LRFFWRLDSFRKTENQALGLAGLQPLPGFLPPTYAKQRIRWFAGQAALNSPEFSRFKIFKRSSSLSPLRQVKPCLHSVQA